jgi:mutator protein MutT
LPNASEPSSTARTETTITVVAAIIEVGDRILITRRLRGTHLEGLWEFPGGKVDPGETHASALRREIREELDADVDVRELVLSTTHQYPARAVVLYFYRCSLSGVPRPMLGQEMRWATREDLSTLDFPAADAELIDMLRRGATQRN